jgi:Flp pilus assembly secretin CpaC
MSRNTVYRLRVLIVAMAMCVAIPACRTYIEKAYTADEVTPSSDKFRKIVGELNAIIIPEMTFYSPATIVDAVELFKKSIHDYGKQAESQEQPVLKFELKLPSVTTNAVEPPRIAALSVRSVSLYDAIRLVCGATDMKWHIQEDGKVRIFPRWYDMEEDEVTRSYIVPQVLEKYLFDDSNGKTPSADPDKVWKAFFEQLGVPGPEWAKFNRVPAIGKLRITSTAEHLASIDRIFEIGALYMIEVEMQIHAFRTVDIEHLRLSGGVTLESLMALRQKGKGKLVATSTVRTKSGQEAIMKAVQEVTYPTSLLTNKGQAESNPTSRSVAQTLMPGNFEMRETGIILQVIPEVIQDGTLINLVLNPQWITLEGWESYLADLGSGWMHNTVYVRQPTFGVTSFQTQVVAKEGETVLLGSCSTLDGEWMHVGFLTARSVDRQTIEKVKAKQQDMQKDEEARRKMKKVVIPEVTFRPPSTIIDAVRFFKEASIDYDDPELPAAQRGVNFVLNLSADSARRTVSGEKVDIFAATDSVTNSVPAIPTISARFFNLYDALKLVCDATQMKFTIRNGIVWIEPDYGSREACFTRIYAVSPTTSHPSTSCETSRHDDDVYSDHNNNNEWKKFYEQLGVKWPPGSSYSYLPSLGLVRITNTYENLEVFEQVIQELGVFPRMAEVNVQIYAFHPEDIEKLRLSGDMSVDALMALRRKGKARPVASASVLTKSGQEAIVKVIQEVRYPTELLAEVEQVGSNVTVQSASQASVPASFAMREVGMILQVVPEVSPDNSQINLVLHPQWVTLDRWESCPAALVAGWMRKTRSFKQPVFGMTSFETETLVKAGETVLLGCSSTPDGKWVHVGFLTVKESR